MRLVPVCISAVLAGCLSTSPAVAAATASTQQAMTIVDFKFAQPKVRLSVGDTMTWTNNDRAPHDVSGTKTPATLQSPLLMKGESWKYTFKVAGLYDYICSVHPDMKAVVDVAAAAKPAAAAKITTAKAAATKAAGGKATAESPTTAEQSPPQAAAEPAAAPSEESAATAPQAEETERLALTATARELESVRQWGAVAVGVLLLGLLVVGLQGSSARANAPKPEWVGVGVSQSRHTRRKPL